MTLDSPLLSFLTVLLLLSAVGVITLRNPVHASLSFLLSLLSLAGIYLELSASFISMMQVLVYAGAILVIFMFVVVLFQDAYQQIDISKANSRAVFLIPTAAIFLVAMLAYGWEFVHLPMLHIELPTNFGSIEGLARTLYIDFFFPFEIVILIFLISLVGALYIGKKEEL